MPLTKFQLVFDRDETVDMQMLIDGEMRCTQLDLRDAPFSKAMLAEAAVQQALKAWMLEAKGPAWMSWTDIEEALLVAGIDVDALTTRYSASGVA